MVYSDGYGYFPDSVSERASRHVRHLAQLVGTGDAATVLFVVQRGDVQHGVRPSDHHDPQFAIACREAAAAGVRFRAVRVSVSLEGSTVEAEIPVDLEPYDVAPICAQCEAHSAHTGWDRAFDGSYRRVANQPFPHNAPPKPNRRGGAKATALAPDGGSSAGAAARVAAPEEQTPVVSPYFAGRTRSGGPEGKPDRPKRG
jgi:hypothetical protein